MGVFGMSFVIVTETDPPFLFDGQLMMSRSKVMLKGQSVKVYKTSEIVAVMRQDFADRYEHMVKELERLRYGDPKNN
jgi:hypothetical protein